MNHHNHDESKKGRIGWQPDAAENPSSQTADENKQQSPVSQELNQYLTFVHRFAPGLQCTARVKAQPPHPGEALSWAFEWTGRPKKKHISQYRRWMLTVNQALADRWGKSVLYALGTAANKTEFWAFEPGKAPKLQRVVPIGIP